MNYTAKQFLKELKSPQYADGGYPKYFVLSDGEALSWKDARENKRQIVRAIRNKDVGGWRVVGVDINYEDANLTSAHSGERIPSAYAENPTGKNKRRMVIVLREAATNKEIFRFGAESPMKDIRTAAEAVANKRGIQVRITREAEEIKNNPASRLPWKVFDGNYHVSSHATRRGAVSSLGDRFRFAAINATFRVIHEPSGREYVYARGDLKKNPSAHRVARVGLPRSRYLSRPSQITRARPSKRLLARRGRNLRAGKRGYFPNPMSQVRGRGWIQEWYETGEPALKERARQLRAAGYKVAVSSMGSQVTSLGRMKMSMLTVLNADENVPEPFKKNPVGTGETLALGSPIYTNRERVPKWSVTVSPLMDADVGGRLLRRRLPTWTKADHVSAAEHWQREARRARQGWGELIEREHKRVFGRPYEATDYKISGIGRDEYSEAAKNKLREFASYASNANAAAAAHYRAAGKRDIRKYFQRKPTVLKNPAPRGERIMRDPQAREAARRFKAFTGHNATVARRAPANRSPRSRVGFDVGPVLAVAYETTRDGKRERYMHDFRRGSRPTLAVSHDGKQLHMLGGAYRFTERGIVDKGPRR